MRRIGRKRIMCKCRLFTASVCVAPVAPPKPEKPDPRPLPHLANTSSPVTIRTRFPDSQSCVLHLCVCGERKRAARSFRSRGSAKNGAVRKFSLRHHFQGAGAHRSNRPTLTKLAPSLPKPCKIQDLQSSGACVQAFVSCSAWGGDCFLCVSLVISRGKHSPTALYA